MLSGTKLSISADGTVANWLTIPLGVIERSAPDPSEATTSVPNGIVPNTSGAKLMPSVSSPTFARRVATPVFETL